MAKGPKVVKLTIDPKVLKKLSLKIEQTHTGVKTSMCCGHRGPVGGGLRSCVCAIGCRCRCIFCKCNRRVKQS